MEISKPTKDKVIRDTPETSARKVSSMESHKKKVSRIGKGKRVVVTKKSTTLHQTK